MAHLDDGVLGSTDAAALDTAVSDGADGLDRDPGLLSGGNLDAVTAPARALVRERPFVALAGAILAGFLVARILSRR